MKHYKQNVDLSTIQNATHWANSIADDIFEKHHNYQQDENKFERLKKSYCKTCFYIRNHLGRAMVTTQLCGLCEKEMIFESTDTDVLCVDCAKKHKLCSHCGGTVNQTKRFKPL